MLESAAAGVCSWGGERAKLLDLHILAFFFVLVVEGGGI